MKNKISVYKDAQSNWYPSYTFKDYTYTMLVEVSFIKLPSLANSDNSFNYRVCAWGWDDFGLEKDFVSRKEAYDCFIQVISLKFVNVEDLTGLGFKSA